MEEILSTPQGPTPSPQIIGIGARLKATRETLRLSEKEAAARLNLSTKLITIMETENFTAGPPATFMRGYLRSYGRLLNFNENEINIAIGQVNLVLPSTLTTTQPTQKQETPKLDRYLSWSGYLVIALLFGLVVIWWAAHPRFNEIEMASKQTTEATPDSQVTTTTITTLAQQAQPLSPQTTLSAPPIKPITETAQALPGQPEAPLTIATAPKPKRPMTEETNNNDDVEEIY